MENKPSASRAPLDVADDNDGATANYEHLSTEQLTEKINVFVNLCMENKINASNAFDIDMIGCFSTWLEKKKRLNNSSDIGSFQEIADYLEASGKVYSYRVDHVSESTSRLVEQFRAMNYKKNIIESEENPAIKFHKPKRSRLMLTTADKLRRKPNELENMKLLSQGFPDLNYKEIFSWGQPSRYFHALYNDTTLEAEMKRFNKKPTGFDDCEMYSLVDVEHIIASRPICPEFHGYVPEEDKKNIDSENVVKLEGIENRFDPDNHKFQSLIDSNNDVENFSDTGSINKKESEFAGLLNCVDGVNRDYSFFNPKLLANWKGPKAWKAQAMLNALKSCNPSEKKRIITSSSQILNIDEETHTKDSKKRIKTINNNSFKVNWRTIESISDILDQSDHSKKTLLDRVVQKWHAIDNICDTKSIVVDVKHNSEFLKYSEIHPDWWAELQEDKLETHTTETFLSNQNIDECDDHKTALKTSFNSRDIKLESTCFEKFENSNSNELQSDDDDNFVKDFKTESNMSIGDLKQEILKIIDQECVFESESESGWSTPLSFLDILLKVVSAEPGLTVAIVFVALLHLSNEQGLKLFKNTNSKDDDDDVIYIAKPVNKAIKY